MRSALRILPILWLVTFTGIHIAVNIYYLDHFDSGSTDRQIGRGAPTANFSSGPPSRSQQNMYEIHSNEIVQLTGSWVWRFVNWGVVRGDRRTKFNVFLSDLGAPRWLANSFDITNPTPLAVFILACWVALFGRRKESADSVKDGASSS